jgi:predicted DNA-binding mobile mystery protein A
MKNQWLTIRQLDNQLKEWQAVGKKYGKPRAGWIKTLRVALSMSAEQFAERLGLTRGRINQLENAEIHNSVTLRTLKDAANALGCELIYAIVPKGSSTLEEIIKKRAEEIAKERVARVAHSMSLEEQTVDVDTLKFQKDELAKRLMEHLNKKFWAESDEINSLAETISREMQKNKELEIPIKKSLRDDPIFINKLKEYLVQIQKHNKKDINESDLQNKFNPEYIDAIKNALIRYQINIKKQDKQTDLLQKLIKNLRKKK